MQQIEQSGMQFRRLAFAGPRNTMPSSPAGEVWLTIGCGSGWNPLPKVRAWTCVCPDAMAATVFIAD